MRTHSFSLLLRTQLRSRLVNESSKCLPRHVCQRHSSSYARGFAYNNKTLGVVAAVAAAVSITGYASSRTAYAESPSAQDDSASPRSTTSLKSMSEIYYDLSDGNMTAARQDFIHLLGPERVDLDLGTRIAHSSTEWSIAPRGELDRPAMIVYPSSTEEVSGIAKICHRRRIPMIAFSGGTSLEGTLAAIHGGVCIDFKHMNQIIAINPDDGDVVVQPAVSYEDLNLQLEKDDLFFPPDPGPGAQIGGMIAQGCSGTNAFRYGTMKDWVLGMTVVLADGTVIKTRGRPRKSSSGYNLTQIMVGSEGTLGFVTEASLRVTDRPKNEQVGVAAFPTLRQAVEAAVKVVRSGAQPGAMEMLCETTMKAVNQGGYCDKEYDEVPTLFFKFAGPSKTIVDEQIRKIEQIAKDASCVNFEYSKTPDEAKSIWWARKTALWGILGLKNSPDDEFISSDTAVPISRLGEAVEHSKKLISESGFIGTFIGHVGDGNFHTGVLYPKEETKKAKQIIKEIQRLAVRLDGTVTGEHGIGLEFRDMVVEELGEGAVDTMRQIKLALDPLCLLNPDKIFRLNIADNGH